MYTVLSCMIVSDTLKKSDGPNTFPYFRFAML